MLSIKQKIAPLLSILMLFNFIVLMAQPPTTPPTGYHWELKWEDNFDGNSLNTTKWSYNMPWLTKDNTGGVVNGVNYSHPDHVSVDNGVLHLKNSENLFPANLPASGTDANNNEYRCMNKSNSSYLFPAYLLYESTASDTRKAEIAMVKYNGAPSYEDSWENYNWKETRWKFIKISGTENTYRIQNQQDSKYLTRTGDPELPVTIKALSTTSDDFKWYLTEVSGGWYQIQNVASGLYLSSSNVTRTIRIMNSGVVSYQSRTVPILTEEAYSTENKQQWKIFGKKQWISGVVQNINKISINRPSYVEISSKMPASTGVWPAFWLLGSGWPPEVDILEYLGSKTDVVNGVPTTYTALVKNVHYVNTSGANASSVAGDSYNNRVNPQDFDTKFNTFGMYMGADAPTGTINQFRWYLNNGQSHSWGTTASYGQFKNLYAILSAGNGAWAGFPDANSTFPNNYDVDWFRYWELVPGCATPVIIPYSRIKNGGWLTATTLNVKSGDKVDLGPQPFEGTWSWSGCYAPTGNVREFTFYPTQSCIITATNTNSCGGRTSVDFTIIVDGVPLSVETISKEKEFIVYTNTFNNTLNVKLPAIYENNSFMSIINTLGQTVLNKPQTDGNEQTIDISTLPNGVYFIKVTNYNVSSTKRFIKQ